MRPPPDPDRRMHRFAWLLALGLFIPLLTTALIVAYWPLPSPKPYRERAMALLAEGVSADNRLRGAKAAAELEQLCAAIEEIETTLISEYTAKHGPPTSGDMFAWRIEAEAIFEPYSRQYFGDVVWELSRSAVQTCVDTGIFKRVDTIASAPTLWYELDPDQPLLTGLADSHDRTQVRKLTEYLLARMVMAAEGQDEEALQTACAHAICLSEPQLNHGAMHEEVVSVANYSRICNVINRLLDAGTLSPAVTRSLLDHLNSSQRTPTDVKRALECERNAYIETFLHGREETSPTARIRSFLNREPSLRTQANAIAAGYDEVVRICDSTDPRLQPDFARVPNIEIDLRITKVRLDDDWAKFHAMIRNNSISVHAKLQATRLLLAIRLYQHDHINTPPAALADLVPDYLPAIPEDPYAPDKQFRYRVLEPREANQKGHRFTLYSVGYDAVDNNATPPPDHKVMTSALTERADPGTDAVFYPMPSER